MLRGEVFVEAMKDSPVDLTHAVLKCTSFTSEPKPQKRKTPCNQYVADEVKDTYDEIEKYMRHTMN